MLVGARQAAEACDLLRPGSLMITLALREPKLDPGLLGEQVGSPIGHVAEFGGACGFLGLGQTAPASMSSGDTGDPGYEQSVTVRTILSHFQVSNT